MPTSSSSSALRIGAFAAFGALSAACASTPPAEVPVVVVPPVALPAPPPAPPEEAPPPACPVMMAFIAGGELRAGNKTHSIPDFCLDVTEVTALAYAACVERGQCDDEDLRCDDAFTYKRPDPAEHPINCVSWQQANRYCRSIGKRLPTADEWEWAAEARSEARRFAWGAADPTPDQICWSKGALRAGTCAVGSFPESRSPQGIDDLFGSVWEWLAPPDVHGIPNVARGGSWQNDSIDVLEGDNAGSFMPGFVRNDVVGFRCAGGGPDPR